MKQYESLKLESLELDQLSPGDNLLQSTFWGRFKEKQGWQPMAFRFYWRDSQGEMLILIRKILRFIPMAYVPFGPDLPTKDRTLFLAALSWELITQLPLGTLFIRYDLTEGNSMAALEARKIENIPQRPQLESPLIKAKQDVQPPDTVMLDISQSPQEILDQMHKKWRYNIRLAEKKGVKIIVEENPSIDHWYSLYKTTSLRDKIALHPSSYYQRLFDMAEESGEMENSTLKLRLFTAYHEEELLAGIVVSVFGEKATYLYGASSNEKRNLMPSYALQWHAINWAKEQGCSNYDFFGIPPTADPEHPMQGLFLFKTGFGGTLHHNLGCWDFPYSGVFYKLFRLFEGIRLWYYKKFKKRK